VQLEVKVMAMKKKTIKKIEALIAKYDEYMKTANKKMRLLKAELKKIKAEESKKKRS